MSHEVILEITGNHRSTLMTNACFCLGSIETGPAIR